MADLNTILIVDDDRDKHGFYWQIFNANDREFDLPFLPPEEQTTRPHELNIEYFDRFDDFDRIFAAKIRQGKRYPLAILDMRLKNLDGSSDDGRGLKTALVVREIDKDINIVIATHLHDIEEDDVRSQLGDNAFLFRIHELDTREKLDAFVATVHALVDRWNARRNMLGAAQRGSAEKVMLSDLVREACDFLRSSPVQLDDYINPGLEVRSHRRVLLDGVDCMLRRVSERTVPQGLVRLYCERSPTGAVLSVNYEGAQGEHALIEQLMREGDNADGLDLYLFKEFLSSCGGSLKFAPGLGGRGTTITADIRSM